MTEVKKTGRGILSKITNIMVSLSALIAIVPSGAAAAADDYWVKPMQEIHKNFTGRHGTVRTAGDSNSCNAYYFSTASDAVTKDFDFEAVKKYIERSSWAKNGAGQCNNNGWTVKHGLMVADNFLKFQNPEVCFIMFGTNDMSAGNPKATEYDVNMRFFVDKLLKNGTIPVISTVPPRRGSMDKVAEYNDELKKIAAEKNLPLIELCEEILKRQPEKWDGVYIYDGTHLGWNDEHYGFDEESLNTNGNMLRNYVTLKKYSEVYEKVLRK